MPLLPTHLRARWQALWHPDRYHGWGKQRQYFEGWYFKLVDATEQHAYALIPGIAYDADGVGQAFVQVMDGKRHESHFHAFGVEDFRANPDAFEVHIGDNYFSATELRVALPSIEGEVRMQQLTPWPRQLYAPGIMGWFSFVPFMQCYHGVTSLDHELSGALRYGEQPVTSLDGGRGYTEKDWGRGFPRGYIWLQTNHFGTPEPTSLMATVAHIPWLGSYFVGFIVGFYYRGRLHRFATYDGSRRTTERVGESGVLLTFKRGKYKLTIAATKSRGGSLLSPVSGGMTGKVDESLDAVIEVAFYHNDELVYAGQGHHAGLEVAGEVDILFNT